MKKTLLAIIAILSILPFCVKAQWNTGTGGIYYNSGNVGIGTISPNVPLHVNGTSGTGLSNVAAFVNSTNGGQILITASGSAGIVPTWNNGSQVIEFEPAGTGNSVISAYTNSLVFQTNGRNNQMVMTSVGNVGIGTISPSSKLSIAGGDVLIDNAKWYNSKSTSGASIPLMGIADNNHIYTGDVFGNLPNSHFFIRTNGSDRLSILNSGNVGIGTSVPDAKLAVNGTIHTQEVKVDMLGWSDYVLKPAYQLKSLSDVKTYIDQNQHLPEVPSEADVKKDGINLGEMNKLLLKKVEELTLYLIEQNKQLQLQQQQIDVLIKDTHQKQ